MQSARGARLEGHCRGRGWCSEVQAQRPLEHDGAPKTFRGQPIAARIAARALVESAPPRRAMASAVAAAAGSSEGAVVPTLLQLQNARRRKSAHGKKEMAGASASASLGSWLRCVDSAVSAVPSDAFGFHFRRDNAAEGTVAMMSSLQQQLTDVLLDRGSWSGTQQVVDATYKKNSADWALMGRMVLTTAVDREGLPGTTGHLVALGWGAEEGAEHWG
eukprot:1710041-Pyramimonas_sp.AAC.1